MSRHRRLHLPPFISRPGRALRPSVRAPLRLLHNPRQALKRVLPTRVQSISTQEAIWPARTLPLLFCQVTRLPRLLSASLRSCMSCARRPGQLMARMTKALHRILQSRSRRVSKRRSRSARTHRLRLSLLRSDQHHLRMLQAHHHRSRRRRRLQHHVRMLARRLEVSVSLVCRIEWSMQLPLKTAFGSTTPSKPALSAASATCTMPASPT